MLTSTRVQNSVIDTAWADQQCSHLHAEAPQNITMATHQIQVQLIVLS